MTILFEPDRRWSGHLAAQLGPGVLTVSRLEDAERLLADQHVEPLVLFGPGTDARTALEFAERQRLTRPALGVLLLRERLDVDTLGRALRAGVRDVVDARDTAAVRAACARSREVSRHLRGAVAADQPDEPAARVVTVFSAKGGCGKSTLATNLAVALADGGRHNVCLVDLDLAFGDVGIMLQLVPERGIGDALNAEHVDDTLVRALLTPYKAGVQTLLAPVSPTDAERIGRELAGRLLAAVRTMFDYVVVDTPPAFSEAVLAALDVSDVQVLVATPDVPALKNLRVAMDMLDLLGLRREARLVVLNRSDARVGLTAADVDRVLRTPTAAHIPSSRDVPISINRGVPIVLDKPTHPVSRAVRELAQQQIADPGRPARGGRGLRDRLGRAVNR